jgi:hypothetical protein
MTAWEITVETALGLGGLMLKIFLIVMPLLMALEWARSRRWFTRAIDSTQPLFRPIGFRPTALFPLLTGIIFGIAYGAGVLIPQARSGELDRRQIFLVTAFLSICHAIIEDTLLFVAVGANGWVIVITRFVAALVIVFTLSKLSWPALKPISGDIQR